MGGYPGQAIPFPIGFSITFCLPVSASLSAWNRNSDADTIRNAVENKVAGGIFTSPIVLVLVLVLVPRASIVVG